MTPPALDRPRVAELIVDLGAGRRRRGSGYLVTSGAVLTAAHVVEAARSVDVRFEPDLPGEWRATATTWWSDPGSDLAVVSIAPRPDRPVPDARFGRIADHPHVLEVQAVGFPRWKLRDDERADDIARADPTGLDGHTDPTELADPTGLDAADPVRRNRTRYRDAHHAVGSVAVLSNWRAGSLEVTIPVAPAEGPRGGPSPWEGMSGAALWAGDRIVGVISKHHPGDGLARLAAVRLDRALDGGLEPAQKSRLRTLLTLPADADRLPLSQAPGDGTSDPDETFTARYRRFMVGTLDRFDFFAVDPRGIPRRQPFTMGYVPLTLKRRDRADDATVSVGARADRELRPYRRALILGVAGSGKSTLMRWLGAVAAGGVHGERGVRTEEGVPAGPAYGPGGAARSVGVDEFSAAPFILELVRFAGGRPPPLADLVARTLRPEMPDGWVRRMLTEGKVLLLLDGLDEVRPRERVRLEEWVDEHLVSYPGIRCIVTTRPSTVAEQWWVDRGFQRFDLLPMSRHSVERYVRGWHRKAREDQPDTPGGIEVRKELERCEQGLLSTLSNRPALRGMSANPLLCGLLCALNLERGEHLPESRKQIYDAAVDLLLVRWPHLRRRHRAEVGTGRGADAAGAGPDGAGPDGVRPDGGDPPLRDEELLKLLQRLAFWLVTNRRLILDHDVAERRVGAMTYGLRSGDEDPRRMLEYLAHESGLLRELPDLSIEFVHRTFRDHLAAKEVVEEENLNLMLDNADKPHWHDVVVMVGAHARSTERTRILLSLLERGKSEPEHRDTLYLLAAAVLEQSAILPRQDPNAPDVRALVERAMSELIPPRTTAAADQLAAAGAFVLDLLPGPRDLSPEQAALVVRAVARIAARWNPPGAIDKVLQFTEKPGKRSISELLETWGRLGDYEAYARDVLSEIDFSRFSVHLQNIRRIEHIGHLKTVTDLLIRNDVPDLSPLADLPVLRRLTLRDNGMTSLAPLENVRSLEVLVLDRCSTRAGTRPLDLSPLGRLRLRRLVVSGLTTPVDLTSLAGVELDSLRLSARPNGARALPAGLRVRHLGLVAGARGTRFAAVGGVRSVLLDWVPDDTDLAALAGMRELRRLVLWRVPGTTPVPALPGVAVTICPAPAPDSVVEQGRRPRLVPGPGAS
ncbi:NACHT domain-containing protein [Streptomyces lushanensis]|uniref:NACHT domain-containing protein n=1 Tax=Streptomyces lushanensis TaxID=1434255 RepID=UPI0008370F6D|nr:NACHT domain-containing protein [Streptomyces lushanensis]